MADNFNLRQFLSENKLTKNAQLLNEFGAQDISTLGWEALEQSTDPEVKKLLADYKVSLSADYDACDASPECRNNMGISPQYFNPSSNKTIAIQKELAKLATEKGIDVKQQAPPAKPAETAKALGFWDKIKAKVGLKEEEDLEEADWRNNPYTPHNFDGVAKQAQQSKEIQAVANRMFPEFGGELENLGAPLTPDQRNAVWATWSKEKVAREKAEREAMQETKLTAKERRLVEMVQNALGITEEEHEFGTNAITGEPLPDPKSQMVAEDEMVQEKALPKYNSIEELMKEIEHGTNEAAHKYKMDEMKRVYEALEAKVGALEEGEHAEHIDQKAVKQMRKDIAALRKAEEKLRKEFDKKFAGKEKKATPAKEKATEALQENIMENFNLKKFLVENKLTNNSRMLNEVDETLMGGIAKNLYLYLSKMKPNNPLDINGQPLQNVKGEIIKNDPKVKMIYQNASTGLDKLAMQGKSKELEKSHQGNQNNAEITLWYSFNVINALGFVKKEEAEAALKVIVDKYPKEVTGKVNTNKMDYEWAKNYAPRYSIYITMKSDKELARTQSARPQAQ